MAAANLSDSSHIFERRLQTLGFPDDFKKAFKDSGLSNLGSFAFAVAPPGQAATDDKVNEFVARVMPAGRRATLGEASLIKRLCFESHTVLVSQIRADNDPSADPSARKMPASERTARIEAQWLRLVGLSLEGPLEVGFSVYDFCAGMLESDQLRYLAPRKCVTRSQEVMNLKPAKELKLDNVSGTITVKESAPQLECPTSTELEVLQALTRRSLAFDCTGLIDFHIAQKWVQDLFSLMQQPVAPGFAKISLIQLLRTDRIAFARMTELARTGIKPSSTGVRPLDALMSSMRSDSAVMFYMLPVLAAPSQPSAPMIKRTWDEAFGNKGNGKGKGKGGKGGFKGKSKWMSNAWNAGRLPEALRKANCVAADNKGRRRCFGYNLDGCEAAKPGEECDKGWHLCAKRNCNQPHPQRAHPSKTPA